MNQIILSDLHLTDNPLDSYRFGVFDWIIELSLVLKPRRLMLLGDITEKKDKHNAQLVNNILESLSRLFEHGLPSLVIITGNHDFIEQSRPYFKFLGFLNHINFITEPKIINEDLYLPYSKDPIKEWDKFVGPFRYAYMHQSVQGGVTQSGQKLTSVLPADFFKGKVKEVFSGDLHTPQQIENITYIGAPYHIYFGDNYQGRILHMSESGKITPYLGMFPKKYHCTVQHQDLPDVVLKTGDQIKITVKLDPVEFPMYKKIKQDLKNYVQEIGAVLCGIDLVSTVQKIGLKTEQKKDKQQKSDKELILQFARRQKLTLAHIEGALKIIGGQNDHV